MLGLLWKLSVTLRWLLGKKSPRPSISSNRGVFSTSSGFLQTTKTEQKWNGTFFDRAKLKDLGVRVQLGHGGMKCPCPLAGPSDFVVFDCHGVHHINVDYCNCVGSVPKRKQLMRVRWFPATSDRPKTCFAFDLLDLFHKLTLQGKLTLYDFYHSILHISDNLQLETIIVRILSHVYWQ